MSSPRLLVIAFDAAELSLVERGIAEGQLPVLRSLRERGAMARLRSTADLLVGSVWPGFYSGLLPPEHGHFGVVQWRPEKMRHERVDGDQWLRTTPFYRTFGPNGPRVLAIDMPFAPTPQPFAGTELVSWNAHGARGRRGGWPADLPDRIRGRHGGPVMRDEVYGPQRPRALLRLRDQLIATSRQQARIVSDLLRSQQWDLALAGFSSGHRGGHKLFGTTGILGAATEAEQAAIAAALPEIYAACDAAIGEVLAAADGASVIVFSPNGMTANTSHHFLLPEMLRRVLDGDTVDRSAEPPPAPRWPDRLRASVPIELRSAVKERLPIAVQDIMARRWRRAERRDWSNVRAFRLIGSDMEGQVQINLRGRERAGTVVPGDEYEALGQGLAPGAGPAGDIVDLAPTILARLGAEVPATMRGQPLLGPVGQ